MRIVIKESDWNKPIRIIVPYHLLINLGIRKSWVRLAVKHGMAHDSKDGDKAAAQAEKILQYLDNIDFGDLRAAMHALGSRKGLTIVDVMDSDGTIVKITT